MSSARRQWTTRPADESAAAALARALRLPRPLARLLAARGLCDPTVAARFLAPRLGDTFDPCALPGMEAAVARLRRALRDRERIAVFGDYDCDGVTSAGLLTRVLTALGGDARPFLPSRLTDGYGFSAGAARRCLAELRPGLIVTVDCGITAVEAVRAVRAGGVDVVVTDHHEPGETLPADADAVVNPKLAPGGPGQELAGVGVAFKLAHALLKSARRDALPGADLDLAGMLDLVAVGTVADVAPLVNENRILVRHGLERLRRGGNAGLRALMEVAGMGERPADSYHLAYVLGPRLNASGRLGSADPALELLLTGDEGRALEAAQHLESANRERRRIEDEIRREAEAEILGYFRPHEHFGLVAARVGWHAGTVGIVAARLSKRFARPSIVIGFEAGGIGRGSCRSVENMDILAALTECASCLESFGGHRQAAGLAVRRERVEELRDRFNAACAARLRGTDLRPTETVDDWVELGEADEELCNALDGLRPTGAGNPSPVWGVRGVRLAGAPRRVGRDGAHLQLVFESGRVRRPAVAFNFGDAELPSAPLDVLFHLERNEFMGRSSLQLRVCDLAPADG